MFTPRKTVGQMVEESKARLENLTNEQLQAEMAKGEVQVVDIRDVRERQNLGWIPGSLHVPRGMLEFWLDPTSKYFTGKVDPEKRIVLHCAGGHRSAISAALLKDMGFPNVAHLEPGFNGWAAAGLPVEGAPAKKGEAKAMIWFRRSQTCPNKTSGSEPSGCGLPPRKRQSKDLGWWHKT